MDVATKVPLSQRINFRVLIFLAVVITPVAFVLFQFLQTTVTGGIIDRGQYLEVDLKTISSFEMDQNDATDAQVPEKFRALNGKRVLLVGEMYQPFTVGGKVTEFDLVYSIAKCCVTASPKIQHFVKSKVVPGKAAEYYGGLVNVMGRFHVGVEKAGGRISSVYRVDVESVSPAS
jgi:hypothetical protein